MITEMHKQQLDENGFFILKEAFSDSEIQEMRMRIESIAKGKYFKEGRRFQAEKGSGKYEDVSHDDMSYKGPDVEYRKIGDLEYDDVMLKCMQSAWIKELCNTFVGESVAIMRMTMMDKPPMSGTFLPWHQDLSVKWPVSNKPSLVLWFPLDETRKESGTLQVIPGSHKHGVIADGHVLPSELENTYAPAEKLLNVALQPRDCLVFNPGILHRSGINQTSIPRRAINLILLPEGTIHTVKNRAYPMLFGKDSLTPSSVSKLNSIPQ